MREISNPFITSGYVSDDYFCDREKESLELIKAITNGNNLAIISLGLVCPESQSLGGGTVPDHKVAEIVDGELHASPRPAPRHAVAEVAIGGDLRMGSGSRDGEEVVIGTAMKLIGANSRTVAVGSGLHEVSLWQQYSNYSNSANGRRRD